MLAIYINLYFTLIMPHIYWTYGLKSKTQKMYLIASYKCNVHTNCIFWQNKYTDTETECGLLNSKHETSHFPDVLKVLLENV